MLIANLQQKLRNLLAEPMPPLAENASLQQRLALAWQSRQLERLNSTPLDPAQLTEFLRSYWEQTRGTSLCYTAQPDAPLTNLLLDVAEFINPTSPISALMPGLSTISQRNDYPDLNTLTRAELHAVLKTHCLSRDGRYLLPVLLLMDLELSPSTNASIPNAYHPDGAYVTPNELEQLRNHSATTEAVFNAGRQYELASSNSMSLWGELHQLCRQLSINAVGARGAEDNAGLGAYPAILAFNEFYTRLSLEQKALIPSALQQQIALLLSLSSDPVANPDAASNLHTCIATRRLEIVHALQGHDTVLSSIRLDEAERLALIQAAIDAYTATKNVLHTTVSQQTYLGNDKQPITRALLAEAGIDWSIRSEHDVEALRQLSAEEIAELLQDATLCTSLAAQLRSLEDLVIFVMETRVEKLPVFFNALAQKINQLVVTPQDLAALLISLQPDKVLVVMQLLGKRIVQSSAAMLQLFNCLPEQHVDAVLETITTHRIDWLVDDPVFLNRLRNGFDSNLLRQIIANEAPYLSFRDGQVQNLL